MKLAIGDLVVYGRYGAGRVASRQKKGVGNPHEIIVLEFADGLSVTLRLERALQYLRPLASEAEMACVRTTLRERETPSEDSWLKRWKTMQAKVATGRPVSLAEVVRDSARRDQIPSARGKTTRLSPSEHDLYRKARQLLADEIGLARGVDPSEADDWITDQLSRIAA
jgi:CarD family transcriptional regulator